MSDVFHKYYNREMRTEELACVGADRYAAEHWVHSHPSVRPCDLSTSDYTWNYAGIPTGDFEKKLESAPRFELFKKDISHFSDLQNKMWSFYKFELNCVVVCLV